MARLGKPSARYRIRWDDGRESIYTLRAAPFEPFAEDSDELKGSSPPTSSASRLVDMLALWEHGRQVRGSM